MSPANPMNPADTSSTKLLQAVLDGGIRSINFFNGRLLTGEDLSKEQDANRQERKELGVAIGEGIAYGLEVSATPGVNQQVAPTLRVTPGLAVNRQGQTMKLPGMIDVSLLGTANAGSTRATSGAFGSCQLLPGNIAGHSLFLFTIAPATGSEGLAPVSGLGNATGACNSRYLIEGVQFRLLPLTLSTDVLNDTDHLRNRLAYLCFGVADQAVQAFENNPFGPPVQGYGLLDSFRPNTLTDCEVPLAVLYWTQIDGFKFIDQWPVRRRLIDPAAAEQWNLAVGDRRLSEAEAMFLQFQDQIAAIQNESGVAQTLTADQRFKYLPAAGYLPVDPNNPNSFNWQTFLGPMAPSALTLVDEGLFRSILHSSFFEDPIAVGSFADSMKAKVAPPVPVNVYSDPSQPNFVLFARSTHGRIRVFITSTNPIQATLQVFAQSPHNNIQLNAVINYDPNSAPILDVPLPIDDVPPDFYTITATATDFDNQYDNELITGGRTTDVVMTMVPSAQGSIHVTLVDAFERRPIVSGQGTVTAQASQTNVIYKGVYQGGASWLISLLPTGMYNLTVDIDGFDPVTAKTPVTSGSQTRLLIPLTPVFFFIPSITTRVLKLRQPALQEARLSMVPNAGRFYQPVPLKSTEAHLLTQQPWLSLIRVEPPQADVLQWLSGWQNWLHTQNPNLGIDRASPALYINPDYTPPRVPGDVPNGPQAYAVFGGYGVPLLINVPNRITPRPVSLARAAIPGVSDETIKALEDAGIHSVDQVAGAWAGLIADAGQSIDYGRYLVIDAAGAVEDINANRRYYDGVDASIEEKLRGASITDDVSLANASQDKLAALLGGQGFASRLIEQARQIVPSEAWSLDQLGLTPGQIATLAAQGVRSKGDFVDKAGSEEGHNELATALSVDPQLISNLRTTALSQLTASSITLTPVKDLTLLPGVNAVVAQKLATSDIFTVDELSKANPADLAKATGLSEGAVGSLVTQATEAGRERLDVVKLAPVSNESAEVLRTQLGVVNVSDLATRNADQVLSAFNNNLQVATAVIEGARVALGQNIG